MKKLLVVGLVWACCAAGGLAQNRAAFADVELVGPVRGVVLTPVFGGSTRIEGELAAGERRLVSVPVPVTAAALNTPPRVTFDEPLALDEIPGRARFLGWRGGLTPTETLSPGLRARARPALAEAPLLISRAVVPLLLIAALVTLAVRKRAWLALLVATAASAALTPLVAPATRDIESSVTLVDGDHSVESWRRIDGALDEIAVPTDIHEFELWTEPIDAAVTWITPLDPTRPWRARARGARLFLASVVAADQASLARSGNGYAAFDAAWLRSEGEWSELGAWALDAPLPSAPRPGSPPGWLASNLPQGVAILIAREQAGAARAVRWVRVSGL